MSLWLAKNSNNEIKVPFWPLFLFPLLKSDKWAKFVAAAAMNCQKLCSCPE